MAIRIICREIDATQQAGTGCTAKESLKTFLVDAPEVELWLNGATGFISRWIEGVGDVEEDGRSIGG